MVDQSVFDAGSARDSKGRSSQIHSYIPPAQFIKFKSLRRESSYFKSPKPRANLPHHYSNELILIPK